MQTNDFYSCPLKYSISTSDSSILSVDPDLGTFKAYINLKAGEH